MKIKEFNDKLRKLEEIEPDDMDIAMITAEISETDTSTVPLEDFKKQAETI